MCEDDLISSNQQSGMSGADHDANTEAADETCLYIVVMEARMNKVMSWESILAYICNADRTWFTASQYMVFAEAIQTANENVKLPTYQTVRGKSWSDLIYNGFPRSNIFHLRDVRRVRNWEKEV